MLEMIDKVEIIRKKNDFSCATKVFFDGKDVSKDLVAIEVLADAAEKPIQRVRLTLCCKEVEWRDEN
jgi:hypothetical protein